MPANGGRGCSGPAAGACCAVPWHPSSSFGSPRACLAAWPPCPSCLSPASMRFRSESLLLGRDITAYCSHVVRECVHCASKLERPGARRASEGSKTAGRLDKFAGSHSRSLCARKTTRYFEILASECNLTLQGLPCYIPIAAPLALFPTAFGSCPRQSRVEEGGSLRHLKPAFIKRNDDPRDPRNRENAWFSRGCYPGG